MSAESWLILAAAAVVAGLVIAYVGRPLLRPEVAEPVVDPRAVALLAEREAVLATLRDLDADHADGRLADADWQSLRTEAVARGAQVLAALDALADDTAGETERLTAAIEAEVALRRAATAPPADTQRATCPACGQPADSGDRFCAACGTRLVAAPAAEMP